jgi:S1-C subfamily serine protease
MSLTGDWRKTDTTWRPTLNPIRSGLHIAPLSQGERKQYGLAANEPGFMVRYAFRTAGKAGLRSGDVVLRVDGQPVPRTESELLAYCRLEDPSRKAVLLEVLNKQGDRREVTLPLVIELVPE